MWQKRLQKIFLLVSAVSFFGSAISGTVGLLSSLQKDPPQQAKAAANSKDTKLQAIEQGYELVLKREPNNQAALQGLVEVRLQNNNLSGAVEPLEQLVKLNPKQENYKGLLAQIKQHISTQNNTVKPSKNSSR